MGTITSGIGLVSGLDIAAIIDSLIAVESVGKINLQNRISILQGQQTALLDINARLLNLKNSANGFRQADIFKSAIATSSLPDILGVTASSDAQPGTYEFVVKQLVANSQKMSSGFNGDAALGMSELSFEFGKGTLNVDTELDHLNGGQGISNGKIKITDSNGDEATIDLTDVVTLNEVLDRINDSTDTDVSASVEGNRLVITDNAGGTGTFSVANAAGYTTATDLGINTVDNAAGDNNGTTGVIAGSDIYSLGLDSVLSSLNGGNGVLIRENVADLVVTASNGDVFEIDLGSIATPIDDATLLSDLNDGQGITISDDEANPDLTITDRDGNSYDIDLTGVTNVGQLRSRVSTQTSGRIELAITDGDKFTVTDTVGTGGGNLIVKGAGENDTDTAEDLGILNVTGVAANSFDGSIVETAAQTPAVQTMQQLIDRVNSALDTVGGDNAGRIVASINATNDGIRIDDTTGGGGNLIIVGTPGFNDDANAAKDLGIYTGPAGTGAAFLESSGPLIATLNSTLVRSLNGGAGLTGSTLEFTDRDGDFVAINNLDQYDSVTELVEAINTAIAGAINVDITVGFNESGNGLSVTDTSGGTASNLVVAGDAAASLGIAADVAATSAAGTNLQTQYVSEASLLKDLNYGQGVGTGSFRITDALGSTADVNIGNDANTLFDVIQEINSRGLAIEARINDTGDGIVIEDTSGGGAIVPLAIESLSGTTAADLNIIGSANVIDGGTIDGSYERTVTLDPTDTISEIAEKINDAGIPVAATLINDGSTTNPFRLSFTSEVDGKRGDLIIDTGGVDLGLSTLVEAKDAKLFLGSADPSQAILITGSSNSIEGAIEGVTLELLEVSDDPVTVTVVRDTDGIVESVSAFVAAFNDAIGRIDDYDSYDAETESRGVLLGNSLTGRTRNALFRLVFTKAEGVSSQFQYLRDVGINVGAGGTVKFDEDKFREAYETDPDAVENLFTAFESTPTPTEEILPGVTISSTGATTSARGIAEIIDDLMARYTNSIDGSFKVAGEGMQNRIDLSIERIERIDQKLEARRARLEAQFLAMETAIAQLQSQSSALASLGSGGGLLG